MKQLKILLSVVVVFIWILIGLYNGFGGIATELISDKIEIARKSPALPVVAANGKRYYNSQVHTAIEEYKSLSQYYGWLVDLPEVAILFISSISFGLLGGVTSIIREMVVNKLGINEVRVISVPILGSLMGVALLGVFYLFPTLLVTNNDIELRRSSVMIACFFGGMFSEQFYKKIENYLFQ